MQEIRAAIEFFKIMGFYSTHSFVIKLGNLSEQPGTAIYTSMNLTNLCNHIESIKHFYQLHYLNQFLFSWLLETFNAFKTRIQRPIPTLIRPAN